ncbi:hypothetical protein HS7_00890 [Sulfolobales archaeon HS-7]|nr:hypothetical protein HS7_00890 [Sulfolobales archaeon HS-7]
MDYRKVSGLIEGRSTIDGAGVKLYRVFGGPNTYDLTDPFLLLDFFGSTNIEDYIAGFPWHPHRGIETVTYLTRGKVEHQDSEGNAGVLYPGDTQWMTAGSGIYHQEMPRPLDPSDKGILQTPIPDTAVMGLQLWINLPANRKMTTPIYRDKRRNEIPTLKIDGGIVKVIGGEFDGVKSDIKAGFDADPTYLDITLSPEKDITIPVKNGYTSLIYVVSGSIKVSRENSTGIPKGHLIILEDGDSVYVRTERGANVIFLSGRPLREPIAWYGPIVMNTQDQIAEALLDLKRGTFVREKKPIFE